jgi:hypothetical protein
VEERFLSLSPYNLNCFYWFFFSEGKPVNLKNTIYNDQWHMNVWNTLSKERNNWKLVSNRLSCDI